MRPRQIIQTLRQCFVCRAVDLERCVIVDSEFCKTKCTSSESRQLPANTKQQKKTLMNIEKKHLNRFQFHSEMNCDCLKWCQICKSSWVCEQFESAYEEIFAKMIFWKQNTDKRHYIQWFIKRIEKVKWQQHTASKKYETQSKRIWIKSKILIWSFELFTITTSKLRIESVCLR